MNTKDQKQIISRRARPAKAPLSREVIVSTALEVLAQEGLAGLSLRKVAAALDTGPASLYVYVANLRELHELMLDQALGTVSMLSPLEQAGGWRERLTAVLISYLNVLSERPGLAQLALSTIPTSPNALRLIETILGLLLEGGIGPEQAAWAVDLLTLYVAAISAEHDVRRSQGFNFEAVTQTITNVPAADYPHVHALREQLLSGGGPTRFGWALDVLINGILHAADLPPTTTDSGLPSTRPVELPECG
jgi:AcrR family transcriptional regulator